MSQELIQRELTVVVGIGSSKFVSDFVIRLLNFEHFAAAFDKFGEFGLVESIVAIGVKAEEAPFIAKFHALVRHLEFLHVATEFDFAFHFHL